MRICGYCNTPREDDQFYPGKAKCKPCQAAYKRDLRKGIHHPIIKPEFKTCRICGITSDRAEFKDNANICIPCWQIWKSQYGNDNRDKLNAQISAWKDANREHYNEQCRKHYAESDQLERQQNTYMSSPTHFLNRQLTSIKSRIANPGPHDPKSGPKMECDIDIDYIMELWDKQKGLCALSKKPMLIEFHNLRAVSIDRIDSMKGHIKGNIQLVRQWVNNAKRHHSNQEMIDILAE